MYTVEVMELRVVEQPTVNGENDMVRTAHVNMSVLWVLLGLFLFQGCAHQAKPATIPTIAAPTYMSSTLVLEAQAETETLRAALASERIKTAKQTATVRSAQQQAASLKARELEHSEKISRLKTEVTSLKEERDKLRMEVAQLRVKNAAAPKVLQLVTQMRTIQTSLTSFSSSLETLSDDIATLRDEVELQKMAAAPPPASQAAPVAEDRMVGTDLIVVKRGDSLWALSQTYGTTVNELKQLNGLTHNTIVTGQFLKIPSIDVFDPNELVELPSKKEQPTP